MNVEANTGSSGSLHVMVFPNNGALEVSEAAALVLDVANHVEEEGMCGGLGG